MESLVHGDVKDSDLRKLSATFKLVRHGEIGQNMENVHEAVEVEHEQEAEFASTVMLGILVAMRELQQNTCLVTIETALNSVNGQVGQNAPHLVDVVLTHEHVNAWEEKLDLMDV